MKFTQGSFFAGERFLDLADAQRQADDWCRVRAGIRVHGTTRQRPAEVFAEHELPLLLPAPSHVRAQNAFYSVPYALIGQQVTVRADDALVKVYHRGQVVKAHPRQPAGGRASDAADFPPGTDVYARRDVDRLAAMAAARGEAIGIYAARILDTDLPWTKMRAVYALIGLCRTYGNGPVEQGGGLPGSPWPRSCAGTGISPPARASRSRPGKSAAWSSADLLADPRSAGSARVRPPARDQPTVPRQQRARRDQPAGALHGRQRPGQCRQDGAVGPVRLGRGS